MFLAPDVFSMVDFYIDELFAPEDPAQIAALKAATSARLDPVQISPNQGKLLYLLAKLVGARRILEVGTLAGYSAIWLAKALPSDGKLFTLERDPLSAELAKAAIERASLSHQVDVVQGDANETLRDVLEKAGGPFDLVFLDADKSSYPFYYKLIMSNVRSGSLIVADNLIRAGTVLAPRADDPSAMAARRFNRMLAEDSRVEALVMQQVGAKGHDGIAIARVR